LPPFEVSKGGNASEPWQQQPSRASVESTIIVKMAHQPYPIIVT
jgi:hypothetical protein